MKKNFGILFFALTTISGCASQENACEDITLASEQIKECQLLQKQITNAKGKPIIRTELERRYQQDCIDVRYYRDAQQEAICGNKKSVEQINKETLVQSEK